jgi:hypothetical protein
MSEVRRTRITERAGPWGFFLLLAYVGAAVYLLQVLAA